jgi:hypothetical protein
MMHRMRERRHYVGWLGVLSLCLLLAPRVQAGGGVAGVVGPGANIAPSEAVFFDGWHFKLGARKARASITLAADQLYVIVKPKDLDPIFDFSETQLPPPVRSVLLGKDLAVLVRYGRSTFVDTGNAFVRETAIGDFRVFSGSQPELRMPWGQSYNDFILYRRKVWPHGPPGVAFCRWNRWNEVSDETWMATFVMADDPGELEDLRVSVRRDDPNLAWAEIFGKGTELHLRIKGQGERVLKAKSDGGGRENTFNLTKVGMSLDDVEFFWLTTDESGKKREPRLMPYLAVTAPMPTWTAGSGWFGSPNMVSPGAKVGGAETAPPASMTPTPPPPAASKLPALAGVWRQQAVFPAIPQAVVAIGVSNTKPGEFACRIAKMKIFGRGTLRADGTLEASFGTANAGLTGMVGAPRSRVEGKVAAVDAQNRATRIEWANGVIYVRIR